MTKKHDPSLEITTNEDDEHCEEEEFDMPLAFDEILTEDERVLFDRETHCCRRLLVAMLERAYLDCFCVTRHIQREARQFVFNSREDLIDNSDFRLTFDEVIELLDAPTLGERIQELITKNIKYKKVPKSY